MEMFCVDSGVVFSVLVGGLFWRQNGSFQSQADSFEFVLNVKT